MGITRPRSLVLDEHQALMWEVGNLLGQWEMLQAEADTAQQES